MGRRLTLVAVAVTVVAGCGGSPSPAPSDLATGADLALPVADLGAGDLASPPGFTPLVACTDTAADVYVTPTGLPALTPATQGDLVRCHRDYDEDQSGAQVDSALAGEGVSFGSPSSGVEIYRVAYRTTRANGAAAASTARVYVPIAPLAFPMPLVVVGHPTEGMGDPCAPSMTAGSLADVALPWASRGYAVLVPDYTGMGNEGVPGYLDNRDQGYAILDGARALRKLFPAGTFEDRVIMEGWSQGGGSVLSAQALAKSYGVGGTLAAVVAFAPEWPIRDNSFAFADMVENPSTDIAYDPGNTNLSYSNHVIWTQRAYGYFSNFSQLTTDGAAGFPAATGAAFVNTMNTVCGEVGIGLDVYLEAGTPPATNGELFDPTFRAALAACMTNAATGCSGLAQEFHDYMGKNVLTADASGAPVLFVQGLLDTVLPPPKEAACIVDKLELDGASVQLCVDSGAQHTNVTTRNIVYAVGWVQALLAGQARPSCPDASSLPIADCD